MLSCESTFAAVADPTRRAILDALRRTPTGQSVAVIAERYPMSRPAISKHLRVLHDAGLVQPEKRGRQRIYRLDPQPLQAIDHWLTAYRQFWAARLLDLKAFAEAAQAARQTPQSPSAPTGDSA